MQKKLVSKIFTNYIVVACCYDNSRKCAHRNRYPHHSQNRDCLNQIPPHLNPNHQVDNIVHANMRKDLQLNQLQTAHPSLQVKEALSFWWNTRGVKFAVDV